MFNRKRKEIHRLVDLVVSYDRRVRNLEQGYAGAINDLKNWGEQLTSMDHLMGEHVRQRISEHVMTLYGAGS